MDSLLSVTLTQFDCSRLSIRCIVTKRLTMQQWFINLSTVIDILVWSYFAYVLFLWLKFSDFSRCWSSLLETLRVPCLPKWKRWRMRWNRRKAVSCIVECVFILYQWWIQFLFNCDHSILMSVPSRIVFRNAITMHNSWIFTNMRERCSWPLALQTANYLSLQTNVLR